MKRGFVLTAAFVVLFTSVNVFFHLFQFRIPLLLYIAIVNGVICGLIGGHFSNRTLERRGIEAKCLYAGVVVGVFLTLLWTNNQIAVEFYINRENLNPLPPFIDYFRFYLIGLGLGIVKSVYYAIVPSIVIFWGIGFLLEKIGSLRKKAS